MSQLKVFDASHLVHRMYRMGKKIITDGVPESERDKIDPEHVINMGIYMFFNSVFSVMKNDRKTNTVFLFDAKNSTKARKEMDPNYKSNRVGIPGIIEAKLRIIKYLNALGLFNLEIEGFEADDIGYFMSRNMKNPITFVTEDVDWYYYVLDNKILHRPIQDKTITFNGLLMYFSPIIDEILQGRGISEYHLTLTELVHKLLLERKAILGDGSDNISGFDGVGGKTANKILLKLNQVPTYDEFKPKGVAEKRFKAGIEKFKTNLQVLGYSHTHSYDFKPHFDFDYNSSIDYREQLKIMATEINSTTIINRLDNLTKILQDNNSRTEFIWS